MKTRGRASNGVRLLVAVAGLAAVAVGVYLSGIIPGTSGSNLPLLGNLLRRDLGVSQDLTPLTASGVMQARQVSVASEFGGLVADVAVQQGSTVAYGQLVVQLDTAMRDAQIAVAEAGITVAEAGLAQARAGARPGQIAVAEAQLAQVEVAQVAAQRAVSDTQALLASPQDVDLQIAVTRSQLAAARERAAEAGAQKDAVEVAKAAFDEAYIRFDGGGRHKFEVANGTVQDLITDALPGELVDQLPADWGDVLPGVVDRTFTYNDYELHLDRGNYELYVYKNIVFPLEAQSLPNLWWQAWVGVNAAAAQVDGLEAKLNQLYIQRANPQATQAQLDAALSAQAQLAAQVVLAQTQVDGLRAGMREEEIAAVKARVDQAYASLQALQQERDMLSLTAPISGSVVEILAHRGEIAAQGAPLVSIADLTDMTLTVYIPETRVGEIQLGQLVEVTVDGVPSRTFTGHVKYISDQAEFTPRNVATVEERENLVFAVDLHLDNQEGLLKPGMPADVRFIAGDAQQ